MARDHLSAIFAALADPTRRAILERLTQGEASVSELAKPFAISPPAITKHLKVLESAGLITRTRHAQWQPCQLDPAPLKEVASWIEQYRQYWDERLDHLEAYLREIQGKEDNQ
jgi:DNA-binding transcriptional ArsR family regulator